MSQGPPLPMGLRDISTVPQAPADLQRLMDALLGSRRERCIERLMRAGASRPVAERLADCGIHWALE